MPNGPPHAAVAAELGEVCHMNWSICGSAAPAILTRHCGRRGRGYLARIICPAGALSTGHSSCHADVDLPSFAGRLSAFVLPDKLFEPMGRLVLSAGAVI
jgi:hypothetical protein